MIYRKITAFWGIKRGGTGLVGEGWVFGLDGGGWGDGRRRAKEREKEGRTR
jgi:hypothetical protein